MPVWCNMYDQISSLLNMLNSVTSYSLLITVFKPYIVLTNCKISSAERLTVPRAVPAVVFSLTRFFEIKFNFIPFRPIEKDFCLICITFSTHKQNVHLTTAKI